MTTRVLFVTFFNGFVLVTNIKRFGENHNVFPFYLKT